MLSSYTSANCLRAAQHLAIATAHLLDPDRDRVAILTTAHCRSNHQHGAYVVYPLQKPSLLDIKTVCLAIRGPPTHSQPDDASFDASLRTAIHLLTSLKWEHGESAPPVYGHVFMLTAFAAGEILEGTEAVKVHILHPGVIPWRVEPPNFSNGWQLRSLYPQDIYNTALYQEDGGLPDHVRTLIHHARSGTDPGVISNFTWKMEPLGNCEIVNYYGDLDFDIMRPGEVATFFIQLKVGESVPGHADDPFKSSEPKSPTELIENLQTMLGDSVVDLLKMEVVYRNVLFSANTDLSVKSHCAVQRVNRSHSEWNIHPLFRSPDRTPSGSLYGTRAKVVMRLAFWTACNKGRQEAIKQIKAMCHEIGKQDGGGIGEVAQMFVKMVLEELTFQQLLQDRWFPWVNDDERNEEEARKLRVLIAALAKKREEEESAQSTSENATPISESSLSGSVQPGKNAAKNAREKARRQRVKMAKKAELEHDESVQSSENATPTSYEPSLSGSIQSSRMNTPTPQALQPQPLRTRANSNVLGVVQNTPSFSGSVQPRDTTPTQYEVGELQSQRLRGRVVSNFSGPVQDTPSSGLTEQFEDMSVATTPLGGGINTTNPVSGSYAGTPTRKNKVKKRGGGTGAGRTSDGSGSSGGEVLGGERTPSGGTTGPEPMAMPGWVRTTSGPGPTGQPMKFSDQRAAPPDPARQVWKGIRKDSYGEGGERQQRQLEGDLNQPISRTSTGTSTGTHTGTSMARVDDDEETKGIKDHALKNMRSLGAETIKSIKEGKKGGKGGKRGGGAKGGEPWLR